MSQITDIAGMSDEEIRKATNEGRLDAMLSGDRDAIAMAKADALIAEREAASEEQKPANVDLGARGGPRSDGQITAAELATMSAEEIAKATRQGRMADLLG